MKCACVFLLLCGIASSVTCQSEDDTSAAPDIDTRWNWNWGRGDNVEQHTHGRRPNGVTPPPPRRPTTPRPETRPTPANPGIDGNGQLIGCPCRSTQETNLVCGTDGNTYGNMGKLRCAVACGYPVELRHLGSCRQRDIVEQLQ